MRYIASGALMTAGVVWIALEARSQDGYYVAGVTRWEHASRAGSAPVVLGGMVVASAVALIFLLHGATRRRLGAAAVVCGATIYLLAWVAAWVGLMGGH
jgi:hypothetical protein